MKNFKYRARSPKAEGGAGQKWWEFYIVRYALGTIAGILIVHFLVKTGSFGIPFPDSTATLLKPDGLPLLLGYGLAFCYLASAPILVFHAARFSLNRAGVRHSTLWIALASGGLALGWRYWAPHVAEPLYALATLAIAILVLLLLAQLRALDHGITRANQLWLFYRRLDRNRQNTNNLELMNSYRHLREHGNAFFVVLLEIALGLCLYVAGKVSIFPPELLIACSNEAVSCVGRVSTGDFQTIVVILVWILPASAVWSIGCHMESEFAHDRTIRH